MKKASLLLVLLTAFVCQACDLGTYEQRVSEPMSSKIETSGSAPTENTQEEVSE